MIFVTRRLVFSASHRLNNPQWDEIKNFEVFDKCNSANGHGHNYVLEVTVYGEIDKETGYLIDLKLLKNIIKDKIENKVDHKHLNYDVDFLLDINPTVENLVVKFWEQLENNLPDYCKLYKIKLWETENNMAEYYGKNFKF